MEVFLFTFLIMIIVFVVMAIDYLMRGKTISGSCGGLAALGIEKACDCTDACVRSENSESQ